MDALGGGMTQLRIAQTWNGQAAEPGEMTTLTIDKQRGCLRIRIDAPWHGDPPPPGPPGPTDRLWEHEVVELFLLGPSGAYFELELGPHGHYLALQLQGYRQIAAKGLPLRYSTTRLGDRWLGEATLPLAYLPRLAYRGNAYTIHGKGAHRRYLALFPTGGEAPDFHRLDRFASILPVDFWDENLPRTPHANEKVG